MFFYVIIFLGDRMKKGFTMVELLTVIILLGIITAIATPMVFKYVKEAEITEITQDVRAIIHATNLYIEEADIRVFPEEGITLAEIAHKFPDTKGYIGRIKVIDNEIVVTSLKNDKLCAYGTSENVTVTENLNECE